MADLEQALEAFERSADEIVAFMKERPEEASHFLSRINDTAFHKVYLSTFSVKAEAQRRAYEPARLAERGIHA